MRHENGFGNVTRLSGNRRKPYWVRVTVDTSTDKSGKIMQKRKSLGCYATESEAIKALEDYKINPLADKNMTFEEVYKKWSEQKFVNLSKGSIGGYQAAYKHCAKLYKLKFADLRSEAMQTVVDECKLSNRSKFGIKILLQQLSDFVRQDDIILQNYANYIRVESVEATIARKIYTKEEIDKLWNHNSWQAKLMLVFLYTGARRSEINRRLISEYDRENLTINVPKGKNKASRRLIPVHNKIISIVNEFADNDNKKKLFAFENVDISDHYLSTGFMDYINNVTGTTHTLHDTRHTFVTVAKRCDMKEEYLKAIVGHTQKDIESKTYTHREILELLEEVNKLSY